MHWWGKSALNMVEYYSKDHICLGSIIGFDIFLPRYPNMIANTAPEMSWVAGIVATCTAENWYLLDRGPIIIFKAPVTIIPGISIFGHEY